LRNRRKNWGSPLEERRKLMVNYERLQKVTYKMGRSGRESRELTAPGKSERMGGILSERAGGL